MLTRQTNIAFRNSNDKKAVNLKLESKVSPIDPGGSRVSTETIECESRSPQNDPTLPSTIDLREPAKFLSLGLPSTLRPKNCRQEMATDQQEEVARPGVQVASQAAGMHSRFWLL